MRLGLETVRVLSLVLGDAQHTVVSCWQAVGSSCAEHRSRGPVGSWSSWTVLISAPSLSHNPTYVVVMACLKSCRMLRRRSHPCVCQQRGCHRFRVAGGSHVLPQRPVCGASLRLSMLQKPYTLSACPSTLRALESLLLSSRSVRCLELTFQKHGFAGVCTGHC